MVTLTYLIGEFEQSIAGQTSLTGLNITPHGRGSQQLVMHVHVAGRNSPFLRFLCKMTV